MDNNLGIIITASSNHWDGLTYTGKEALENEHIRRAANRKLISCLFLRNSITPVALKDPTRELLEKSIKELADQATADSFSYIYINCHGNSSGLWMITVGDDTVCLSYTALKELLDTIPGRKVLMIESCYSGASITADKTAKRAKITAANLKQSESESENNEMAAMVNAQIIKTFGTTASSKLRKGELRDNGYLVITACQAEQSAWGSTSGNIFTQKWCKGAGWDWEQKRFSDREADYNKDQYVSLTDLCNYTAEEHITKNEDQDDMCYPENSTIPVFGDLPVTANSLIKLGRIEIEYTTANIRNAGSKTALFIEASSEEYPGKVISQPFKAPPAVQGAQGKEIIDLSTSGFSLQYLTLKIVNKNVDGWVPSKINVKVYEKNAGKLVYEDTINWQLTKWFETENPTGDAAPYHKIPINLSKKG